MLLIGRVSLKSSPICLFLKGKDAKLLAELEKTLTGKRNKAKGLKADLERAIQAKNIDHLEKAIDAFKQAGLTQVI